MARLIANPPIIVAGRNRTGARDNIKACIGGYVQALPEAKRRFFTGDRMKKGLENGQLASLCQAAPQRDC